MKIIVLSAMQEEIAPTIKEHECNKIDQINGQDVFSMKGKNHEFYFMNSGIGKVNASITTSVAIERYNPDLIISIGTAGGLHSDLKVGDFVIADKMAFWDVDATAFDYELGQLPQMEKYFEVKDHSLLKTWVSNIGANVHTGTIVTADTFVCKPEQHEFIRRNFDNVYAMEMESTSILMAAQSLETNCIILRTISDLADQESTISFDQYLNEVSEKFKYLINEIDKQDEI